MLYLILKSINPATRIIVSNIKDKIDKSTLDKFGINVKDILDEVSSYFTIIIDKGRTQWGLCLPYIQRDIFPFPNSTFNSFI